MLQRNNAVMEFCHFHWIAKEYKENTVLTSILYKVYYKIYNIHMTIHK